MLGSGMEWASVAPNTVIVASSDGAWLHARAVAGPFLRPMRDAGSVPTTRALLDAAVRAGYASAGPRAPREMTPERWAYRLCDMYRTTHATPPLMRKAAARFAAEGRDRLAAWALRKAEEEAGHDDLALRDLTALGYDAPALAAEVVPAGSAALVAYFRRCVEGDDPIGCVGYAYALERLALEIDDAFVARVEAALPAGVRATRCLRVHGAAGTDRRHVEETIETVAALSGGERAAVARAAYEAAALCAADPEEPHVEHAIAVTKTTGPDNPKRSRT